jgi:ABC-type transporter Mla subunit MlaD
MIKLSLLFKKSVLVALVAALALAALPITSASASPLNDPANPPAGTTQVPDQRLEHLWVRLQRVYERQGRRLERADGLVGRLQNLVDRLAENGKDVTSLQAALDAFEAALKDAHPIYESAKGITNAHQGFDAQGNVTDHEKAVETVKELGAKLKEVHQIVGEPGKALREAIQAYRNANRAEDSSTS